MTNEIIARCRAVLLCHKYHNRWIICVDGVKHEMSKNDAHLVFNDYLGQVMSGGVAEINLELRGK